MFISGYWAFLKIEAFKKLVLIGLPLVLATIWGVFNVPNDPSRSGKAVVKVNGIIRLVIELVLFGFGSFFFYDLNKPIHAIYFSLAFILHNIVGYQRILWLVKQKV